MKQNLKIVALLSCLVLAVVLVAGCTKASTNTNVTPKTVITTDKASYAAGETITVTYSIVGVLEDGAWLGIVPSSTLHGDEEDGDAVDVDYKYLEGSKSGTKTFSAPLEAGNYDFRVYSSDQASGIELGYGSFVVATE